MPRKTSYYFEGKNCLTANTVLNLVNSNCLYPELLKYFINNMKLSSQHYYLRKVLKKLICFSYCCMKLGNKQKIQAS